MKIVEENKKKKTLLKDISVGECFVLQDLLYLVTDEDAGDRVEVFCFVHKLSLDLPEYEPVTPVEVTLTYEKL